MARRRRAPAARLGVDETSYQKRHQYVTVLSDVDERIVIDVAQERSRAALEGLLEALPEDHRDRIEAIAMNMSGPYADAIRAKIPRGDAVIAYDRFHVAKMLNERVNDVRKQENRALRAEGDQRLKGARFLFLQNPENLDDDRLARLDELKAMKLKVARAWAITEHARSLWSFTTRSGATRAWKKWIGWAQRCRLEPMVRAAATIRRHLRGIVTAAVQGVTGAVCESLNAKIQRVKAAACGFRSKERFRTPILFYCGGLDLYPAGVRLTHTKV